VGGDLTGEQEAALAKLHPLLGDEFYLAGGVAVALRLHHRVSRDLDLFTSNAEPESFEESASARPGP
jgi:Nucleotidyl transferase AbiEii toxin, Type IV TA system